MGRSRKTIRNKLHLKPDVVSRSGVTYFKKQASKENAIAYCHNKQHIGYLSETLLKQHDCIAKGCVYLERYEHKAFWLRRRLKKVLKKYHNNDNVGFIVISKTKYKTDSIDTLVNVCLRCIRKTHHIPEIDYWMEDKEDKFDESL